MTLTDCTCPTYRRPHLKVTHEKGSGCLFVQSSTGEPMDTAAIRRAQARRKTVRYRVAARVRRMYTRLAADLSERLEALR
ncbi:hypothetical protein [Rothia mucilaginosa]|uniref:hypothetical protein n=1 Tax=Rothia mucilaginosa TaxID=43675 RepID=UPI0028D7D4A2|nr:hypothetical protein [Rothia mucilaginosa]